MEDLPDRTHDELGAPASPLPPVVDEGQERGEETMPVDIWERNTIAIVGESVTLFPEYGRQFIDRMFRPWLFPDANPMPTFVPLPRLASFMETVTDARGRVRDAWAVLRGTETIYDGDDW